MRESSMKFLVAVVMATVSMVTGIALDPLPTDRPLVIAHRGSSGTLPEHTVEAYQLAVEQGADIIECDLAVTKDAKLMCLHEPFFNSTTDVHTRPEFNDRIRTYFIPSELKNVTDYFTIDFTMDELKTLRKIQVRQYRDQSYNGQFAIASFDEYVAVAKNSSNLKTVGIYPETKAPLFYNTYLSSMGTTIEDLLLKSLNKYGYTQSDSPCFIQSFSYASLEYMRNLTKVSLVYLIGNPITEAQMQEYSSFITGIGPSKQLVVRVDPQTNKITSTTNFMEKALKYGFKVHPYTFRNENQFLAFDYGVDPDLEYEKFLELGVHGFFTDFPLTLSNYIEARECMDGNAGIKANALPEITLLTIIILQYFTFCKL